MKAGEDYALPVPQTGGSGVPCAAGPSAPWAEAVVGFRLMSKLNVTVLDFLGLFQISISWFNCWSPEEWLVHLEGMMGRTPGGSF